MIKKGGTADLYSFLLITYKVFDETFHLKEIVGL